MQSSRGLTRLEHETRTHHTAVDGDRFALLTSRVTPQTYRRWLERVYGFESPVESAIQVTAGLDEVIDLRSRTRVKLLRSDLVALGVSDPATLPRCRSVSPLGSTTEALGWIYVLERNTLLHGILRRNLEQPLAEIVSQAGAYLSGREQAVVIRMRELGHVLDAVAKTQEMIDRVVAAAHAALRCQQDWFAEVAPRRIQVA